MKTTTKVQIVFAFAAGVAVALAGGCELVTDFDRSLIDSGVVADATDDVTNVPFDASFDAPNALTTDASDAATDGATDDAAAADAADDDASSDAADIDATDAADASDAADAADAADSAG